MFQGAMDKRLQVKFGIVEIHWLDSAGPRGWCFVDEAKPSTLLVTTVAYLLDEDEESVTVASSIMDNDSAYTPLTIPKCAIVGQWDICPEE